MKIKDIINKIKLLIFSLLGTIGFIIILIFFCTLDLSNPEIVSEQLPEESLELKTVDKDLMFDDCMNSFEYQATTIESKIEDLKSLFKKDSKAFSFCYTDLTTNNSFCENENGYLFAASTTKAPVDIYIYELANEGTTNLNDKLKFTSSHKRDGTGILKKKPLNTYYTIRELVEYSVRYSDNSAHSMLVSKYGKGNIKKFWQGLGAKTIFMDNTLFSKFSSRDGNIYMKELYRFYQTSEYGEELMQYFKNVSFKLINIKNLQVAHKYGWTNNYLHDSAIVFDEKPFALTIMSTKGDANYKYFFSNISNKVYEIHKLYWNEKKTYCNSVINN